MNKDLKEIAIGLAWGGGIVVLALTASHARTLGYIDADTVTRLVIGANGLMIAWYGNRLPKALAPSADARKIARVAGWSLVFSGLTYAALWAFAPIEVAIWMGCAAILAGMAVTFSYGMRLRAQARRETR